MRGKAISCLFSFLVIAIMMTITTLKNTRENHTLTVISSRERQQQQRRRLQHRPYYYWYSFNENEDELVETVNGVLPKLSCPLGTYRDLGDVKYLRPGGLRLEGCIECPKGLYGSSTDLKDSKCTAECPKGTYLDRTGGKSIKDCRPCPEGTFGEHTGLTSAECSGSCTDFNTDIVKYYSDITGVTSKYQCKVCPEGYQMWQCEYRPNVRQHLIHDYEDPREVKRYWGDMDHHHHKKNDYRFHSPPNAQWGDLDHNLHDRKLPHHFSHPQIPGDRWHA